MTITAVTELATGYNLSISNFTFCNLSLSGNSSNSGDLILIYWTYSGTATVTSVTDSAGNTYAIVNDFSATCNIGFAYCSNSIALEASNSIVVQLSAAVGGQFKAVSVTSTVGLSLADDGHGVSYGLGTSSYSVTSTSLPGKNRVSLGIFGCNGSTAISDTWTEAAGFTSLTPYHGTDGQGHNGGIVRSAYELASAAGTVTYAPSNGTGRVCSVDLITFTETGPTSIFVDAVSSADWGPLVVAEALALFHWRASLSADLSTSAECRAALFTDTNKLLEAVVSVVADSAAVAAWYVAVRADMVPRLEAPGAIGVDTGTRGEFLAPVQTDALTQINADERLFSDATSLLDWPATKPLRRAAIFMRGRVLP